MTAISMSLQLLTLGSQGRIEKEMNRQRGDSKGLRASIELLLAKMSSVSRDGTREGSILTTYSNDDKELWRSFRRDLAKNGYKSGIIRGHKDLIMAYVKELEERKVLDELVGKSQASDDDEFGGEEDSTEEIKADGVSIQSSSDDEAKEVFTLDPEPSCLDEPEYPPSDKNAGTHETAAEQSEDDLEVPPGGSNRGDEINEYDGIGANTEASEVEPEPRTDHCLTEVHLYPSPPSTQSHAAQYRVFDFQSDDKINDRPLAVDSRSSISGQHQNRPQQIFLQEAGGRKVAVPFQTAATWKGIHAFIQGTYWNDVQGYLWEGEYYIARLSGGAAMFEHFWESFVQPGMTFKLGVWGSYQIPMYTSAPTPVRPTKSRPTHRPTTPPRRSKTRSHRSKNRSIPPSIRPPPPPPPQPYWQLPRVYRKEEVPIPRSFYQPSKPAVPKSSEINSTLAIPKTNDKGEPIYELETRLVVHKKAPTPLPTDSEMNEEGDPIYEMA